MTLASLLREVRRMRVMGYWGGADDDVSAELHSDCFIASEGPQSSFRSLREGMETKGYFSFL